jgi:hypothetical protein
MAIKTITRLYDSYDEAEKVVRDLRDAGVPAEDVSIVASNASGRYADSEAGSRGASGAATGAGIGAILGGGAGLLAGIGALAIPGIGPVVAAGWLMSALAGAGVAGAAGGLLGALTGAGVSADTAHVYAEGVRRGGAVVAVRVDEALVPKVEAIMTERAVDWQSRSAEYRATGWSKFDEQAPPLSDETRADRRAP